MDIYEFGIGDSEGFLEVEYEEFGADFGRTGGSKKTKIRVKHINEFLKLKPDIVKFKGTRCGDTGMVYSNPWLEP